MRWLARFRVPLGFGCAAAALLLARPSWTSWMAGLALAGSGEALRIWAAGHIEKGREITRSGPYRWVRHPLYLGSVLIGTGFATAARSWLVLTLAVLYLGLTIGAAIRTEEAALDRRFGGAYTAYRAGQSAPVARAFSWSRAAGNREHRAVLGLVLAFGYLAARVLAFG
jgi:protein-S-isoprenylcysteine O-methyltransferase Ste14